MLHLVRLLNMRKRSIFFFQTSLSEKNLLCYNLDVMHIEKNVCDNIIDTLLDTESKTKDSLNASHDLKKMGIKKDLHPTIKNEKWSYSVACYILSKD